MFETLFQSSYFSLFVIVALGYMLGNIRIKGLSLDVSAVIFIALLFGHFGVVIDKSLGNFGLVLFIYAIGMQAGPGFFNSFRTKGKVLLVLATIIVFSAGITAIVCKLIWKIETEEMLGLMAGALSSTPGLAVAIDSTSSSSASIAYGIAYPFGVIGVIIFINILPRILKQDPKAEAKRQEELSEEQHPKLLARSFIVNNHNVFDKKLKDLNLRQMTQTVISRVEHDGVVSIPNGNQVLRQGDRIKAVGNESGLQQLEILLGDRSDEDLPLSSTQDLQTILMTNKKLGGRSLASLNLQENFGVTITRVRRSGIDISPTPELKVKFGDKITVVGTKENMQHLGELCGNNAQKLSDTDFFPIALGIVFGILFGQIRISFSDNLSFSPGLTGGVLLVAIGLSALGRTGSVVWSMSGSATQLLRQLGLLLFLAEVGTSAGVNLVSTFQESGLLLFGVGLIITLVPMIIATVVSYCCFKINILELCGVITGGMTSTPGLVAANSLSDSSVPSVAYATVYPVAMILLILLIQVMAIVC